MFGARFVAGMGAAAVLMSTVAGVRDRFVGNQMAHIMSLIFTLFLFTPVLAPFIGLAILAVSSWQMVFLTPPIFAVIVLLWSLQLEESLHPPQRLPLDLKSIKRSITGVLGNRTFLRYVAATTLLFTALSSYVASSEHIIGEIYHKPKLFPWFWRYRFIPVIVHFNELTAHHKVRSATRDQVATAYLYRHRWYSAWLRIDLWRPARNVVIFHSRRIVVGPQPRHRAK